MIRRIALMSAVRELMREGPLDSYVGICDNVTDWLIDDARRYGSPDVTRGNISGEVQRVFGDFFESRGLNRRDPFGDVFEDKDLWEDGRREAMLPALLEWLKAQEFIG